MSKELNEDVENNPIMKVIVFIIIFTTLWYGYSFYVNYKVTNDAIKQYDIVEKTGDRKEICREMTSVIAAYLYVKDEENYNKWKQKKDNECN